jgi:hypothetical protein
MEGVKKVDSIKRGKGAEEDPSNGIEKSRLPVRMHGHAALVAGAPEH